MLNCHHSDGSQKQPNGSNQIDLKGWLPPIGCAWSTKESQFTGKEYAPQTTHRLAVMPL